MQRYEDIPAINWSRLKDMAVSPRMYRWRGEHPRRDTPALLLGRAVHAAILEPAEFEKRYIVGEEKPCAATTKAGKPCSNSALPLADHCGVHGGQAEADAWRVEHPNVEVITAEQGETIELCAESIRSHPDAADLLSGAHVEQVITWVDEATGLRCKARLDTFDRRRVVDLKTTGRPIRRFAYDVEEYLYYGQLAWYRDGGVRAGVLDDDARAYIDVVETDEPFDCGPFELAGADLIAGRALYRRLLDELASCMQSGHWYGRFPTTTRLELSRRAIEFAEEV